jgi:glycine oxidase
VARRIEFLVIGQGLAGTAVGWHLLRRGRSVLVVERDRGGCSRLAAGLITPITGKRLARSWRWDDLYPIAVTFYRLLEREAGTVFFHQRPALRLFASAGERAKYQGTDLASDVRSEWLDAPLGAFLMPDAARLDVPKYLNASRSHFAARGAFQTADVSLAGLTLLPHGIAVPDLDLEADRVVFCRGFEPSEDPWFGGVRFNAAKGEFLTIRAPDLGEERVIHCGLWLAPLGGGRFRAGATYSWHRLDGEPTPQGRAEIETRLRAFLKVPFEVTDHQAAVRPIIDASVPAVGVHPQFPQLAYLNGLGSKGSLLSPYFAGQLVAHLLGEGEIDPEVNVSRFL